MKPRIFYTYLSNLTINLMEHILEKNMAEISHNIYSSTIKKYICIKNVTYVLQLITICMYIYSDKP